MSLKIHILCTDGSPLGVTSRTIYGDSRQPGVGGAELSMLTMCEEWTKAGHNVVLYNDPREKNELFDQRYRHEFVPKQNRDILIIFRSPNPNARIAKGKKVWWSTDQNTIGDFRGFAAQVDQIVTISEFHASYFKQHYGIENPTTIDLPVRVEDFDPVDFRKKENQFIFTSIPDRGLQVLSPLWDKIKKRIPTASLIITSDYRLWGVPSPQNADHVRNFRGRPDVTFLGAVDRKSMCEAVKQSDCLVYPSTYEELFCVSVAEAQYGGCVPITTSIGAIPSTTFVPTLSRPAGTSVDFIQEYIEMLVARVSNRDELGKLQKTLHENAKKRFHPNVIVKQWEEKVFA